MLPHLIDLVLHLDKHLNQLVSDFGLWSYAILFAIVFAETGLVVVPFLPGDSLLFACGALAGGDEAVLQYHWLILGFCIACFVGDNVNYHIGKAMGPRVFAFENSRFFNKKHLQRTQDFFNSYGGKAVILARFVPIVRTFMPFVAGIGAMKYRQFALYSVGGCLIWVGGCVTAGYYFGRNEWVKKNFAVVILAVIVISFLPPVIEVLRHRYMVKKAKSQGERQA